MRHDRSVRGRSNRNFGGRRPVTGTVHNGHGSGAKPVDAGPPLYGPDGPHAELYRFEINLDGADNNRLDEVIQDKDAATGDATLLGELAKLSRFEYDRRRKDAAKQLGITVATLDKAVAESRAQASDDEAELPHWRVQPCRDRVDGGELLDRLHEIFTRYVILPPHAATCLALWVLHAWTLDASDISPFMILVSPEKRCGKTTVLILLYWLTPRSELASNISASAIFRYIEDQRPTLLIDEADSFVNDNEEMRGILNSGHTKTAAHVIRNVEVNGEHKPRRFSTWAPKAIATIRKLADTLEDRAIVVTMQRKTKAQVVARLRRDDNADLAELRSRALRWSEDNVAALKVADPTTPHALNDRAADNWRPLFAIADQAGSKWPETARVAALSLAGELDAHAADLGSIRIRLLADIRMAFDSLDADELTTATLLAELILDPARPWAEWRNGKPMTPRALADLLREFKIFPQKMHGQQRVNGYARYTLEDAFSSYLPPSNLSTSPNATAAGISCENQTCPKGFPERFENGHETVAAVGDGEVGEVCDPPDGPREDFETPKGPFDDPDQWADILLNEHGHR